MCAVKTAPGLRTPGPAPALPASFKAIAMIPHGRVPPQLPAAYCGAGSVYVIWSRKKGWPNPLSLSVVQ